MRKLILMLGTIALLGAASPPPAFVPSGGTPVHEQRLLYDTVKLTHERYPVCDGGTPRSVKTRHTAGDIAAAIVSLGLWMPAHVYVMC